MKTLNMSFTRKRFNTYQEAESFAKDLERNSEASVKIVPVKVFDDVLLGWAVDWCQAILEDEDES